MNPFLDGWMVLTQHIPAVFGIVLVLFLGCGVVSLLMLLIFDGKLTAAENFALSMGGCLLPVMFGGLSLLQSGGFQRIAALLLALMAISCGAAIVLRVRGQSGPMRRRDLALPGLIILFSVSVVLRLAFVSRAIVPSYFDSAEHYSLVKALLPACESCQTMSLPTSRYYHLGFHLLAAFLTRATGSGINATVLILGQIILAVIPVPIFFMLRHETGSNAAGLLAVLLAGFGWHMPAYAVNWGKYPALAGLVMIQFVLGTAYLMAREKRTGMRGVVLLVLAGAGIGMAAFLHTRSVIILGIAFAAWKLAGLWCQATKPLRSLILSVLLGGMLAEFLVLNASDMLESVFDPYLQDCAVISITMLVLSPFALGAHPRMAFSGVLTVFLLLAGLLVPVPGILPGYGSLTLLDRPFVEIILYLPLTIVGGLGYAGLAAHLRQRGQEHKVLAGASLFSANALLVGVLLLNVSINYNFYTSSCCQIVGYDDLVAMDWMDKNLAQDSRVLISTTELRIFESNTPGGYAGADAGVWITPLIGRQTLSLPYTTEFGPHDAMDWLCAERISHIYVGGMNESFSDPDLAAQPDRYRMIFSLPKARVFEVAGCLPVPA